MSAFDKVTAKTVPRICGLGLVVSIGSHTPLQEPPQKECVENGFSVYCPGRVQLAIDLVDCITDNEISRFSSYRYAIDQIAECGATRNGSSGWNKMCENVSLSLQREYSSVRDLEPLSDLSITIEPIEFGSFSVKISVPEAKGIVGYKTTSFCVDGGLVESNYIEF